MESDKNKFTDSLDKGDNSSDRPDSGATKNHNLLEDKWNEIQEEYMNQHPELSTEDLYFEGGGFNGMIEKISEITGKSTDAVRKEIRDW
ncbi:MAG: hypothetical protein R3213_02495 [Flavobacteriaceae bacterium]|nr:hypothetical protein [Flavobacteriaceae bacterium]